jgi:hypothetical protein
MSSGGALSRPTECSVRSPAGVSGNHLDFVCRHESLDATRTQVGVARFDVSEEPLRRAIPKAAILRQGTPDDKRRRLPAVASMICTRLGSDGARGGIECIFGNHLGNQREHIRKSADHWPDGEADLSRLDSLEQFQRTTLATLRA